ncbi:MAG: FKBP-type peptidyl-prolyl cis-trans isomerase, partial [Alphaproteobacteria bacterium]
MRKCFFLFPLMFVALLLAPWAAMDAHAAGEGLLIKDIVTGDGAAAKRHSKVSVHYTGWLMDGKKFDSSLDRGKPFEFIVGLRQVIGGWDQGLVGMKVGGKRELVIPPELGYGANGAGDAIPPNATLRFEIELLAVDGPTYVDLDTAALAERV